MVAFISQNCVTGHILDHIRYIIFSTKVYLIFGRKCLIFDFSTDPRVFKVHRRGQIANISLHFNTAPNLPI